MVTLVGWPKLIVHSHSTCLHYTTGLMAVARARTLPSVILSEEPFHERKAVPKLNEGLGFPLVIIGILNLNQSWIYDPVWEEYSAMEARGQLKHN